LPIPFFPARSNLQRANKKAFLSTSLPTTPRA
jgi:hypothetical protein